MRFLRKLFKYTLRIILVLFTLVVLVMILLYIPAIQNFVKGKAEQYVNRNLDMKLSVGRILLKFPLDLAVENIYLGQTEKDTLLYADVIQVNVALTELLKKEIEVRRLVVENAAVHFEDSLSGLKMNLVLEELNLRVDRLNLSRQEAEIPFIALKGGKIMEITSVAVRKVDKEGSRMRGIASVLLDDSFAVHDIRIIEGENGLFIAMPSRKTPTGGYRDIAHPINPEVRAMFQDKILEAYQNTLDSEE